MARRPSYSTRDQRRTRRDMQSRGITPEKGMGQNFMTDTAVAAWIVDQLDIQPNDHIIEIGPGMGALTVHLVERAQHHLTLLEKDDDLVKIIRKKFGHLPHVHIIHGDALTYDLRPHFKVQPCKVIGALPYSVGTEIVRRWTENPSPLQRAVFTLQKEVCDRLCAAPSTSDYGLLSVRTQLRWEATMLRHLPPDIFVPRPKVDSGVLLLTPRLRSSLPVFDDELLGKLLVAGFSQRRKMLRNLIGSLTERPWEDLAVAAGLPEMARGQELTLPQWIALTNACDTTGLAGNAQSGDEVFDIVDESDRVLRQATRRDVHAHGWLHRAVHILVLNSHGEVFLQKRSHLKDIKPSAWDSSAAGHVDAGEDYLPCALRELHEELGIKTTADRLRRIVKLPASPGTGMEFVELYVTAWTGRLRWPAAEIETGQWFSPAEIDAWTHARPADFAEGFLTCWHHYRSA